MSRKLINLIGYASGIAANNVDCALGPWYLYYHQDLFTSLDLDVKWQNILDATGLDKGLDAMPVVQDILIRLGSEVLKAATNSKRFCVIGGDHASAFATWNAVALANQKRGDIGLIWIDAHMDSHTPHTSETKNIHGMPLAHLFGQGDQKLLKLFDHNLALKPENVCLIGARSYESGEEKILSDLGVKIFFMDEVKKIGVKEALHQAIKLTSESTCGIGISLDLDGIDPFDAPGVGCSVEDGINGKDLVSALRSEISVRSDILGLEIVEYNPILDVNQKTAKLLVELLHAVYC